MATPMAIRKPTYVDQQQSSELGQSLESEQNKSTLHGDEKRSLLSKESEKNFEQYYSKKYSRVPSSKPTTTFELVSKP